MSASMSRRPVAVALVISACSAGPLVFGVTAGNSELYGAALLDHAAAVVTPDEIHYAYGDMPTEVVFNWRDDSGIIEYG